MAESNRTTSASADPEAQSPSQRREDRPLFSLGLAAILTDLAPERLAGWVEVGLVGRTATSGSAPRHPLSFRDLHTIDALRQAIDSEVTGRAGQLHAAYRAKSDFMRLVGHELRAPMSVVRGYVSLIRDGSMGRVSESLSGVLPLIEAKLAEMDRLANQMLEVARLEDGRMLLESRRVDLRRVVSDAIQSVEPLSDPDHEFRVTLPSREVPVMGDYSRLLTIVSNLLSNALKYSPDGGAIECSAAVTGSRGQVSVRDHGIGISEEAMGRLFARFERLESSLTKGIGGTGLGLYLSRELARRHGGDIIVESHLGAGSVFTVDLPCAWALHESEAAEVSPD